MGFEFASTEEREEILSLSVFLWTQVERVGRLGSRDTGEENTLVSKSAVVYATNNARVV